MAAQQSSSSSSSSYEEYTCTTSSCDEEAVESSPPPPVQRPTKPKENAHAPLPSPDLTKASPPLKRPAAAAGLPEPPTSNKRADLTAGKTKPAAAKKEVAAPAEVKKEGAKPPHKSTAAAAKATAKKDKQVAAGSAMEEKGKLTNNKAAPAKSMGMLPIVLKLPGAKRPAATKEVPHAKATPAAADAAPAAAAAVKEVPNAKATPAAADAAPAAAADAAKEVPNAKTTPAAAGAATEVPNAKATPADAPSVVDEYDQLTKRSTEKMVKYFYLSHMVMRAEKDEFHEAFLGMDDTMCAMLDNKIHQFLVEECALTSKRFSLNKQIYKMLRDSMNKFVI